MKTKCKFSLYPKSPPFRAVCKIAPLLLLVRATFAQTGQYLYTGSEQTITLNPGLYNITAYGAQGGNENYYSSAFGGLGAEMEAEFSFTAATTLTLLVGGAGFTLGSGGAGGGGGSFVVNGTTPLVVAGGGGGAGIGSDGGSGLTGGGGGSGGGIYGGSGGSGGSGGGSGTYYDHGGGGGGFYGNGGSLNPDSGGNSFVNGGGGGYGGGFGGGGGSGGVGGGGGGGYSGGGGGGVNSCGGGGGSIIDSSAIADLAEVSGVASPDGSPDGEIIITAVPEPTTWGLLAFGAWVLLRNRQNRSVTCQPRNCSMKKQQIKSTTLAILAATAFGLSVQAQPPITNGLVAYYPFNGNVNDASGNGNSGTIGGYDWHFGSDRFGQENALYLNTTSAPSCCFDGTYVSAARPTALDFSADFTLSVWVNMPSNTPVDYPLTFISNGPDQPVGAATNGANLRITPGDGTIDGLQFIYNHEDGEVYINVQTIRDAWWQATVVRSGTSLTVFRNGSQLTNVVMTSVVPDSPEIWIGRMICPGYPTNCPGSYCMVGGIDDVLMYNRALSTNEVMALYHQGFYQSPPQILVQPQNQVGYWGFGASLSVRADGSSPLTYQWFIDGFPIVWATNATLEFTNLDLSAAGTYDVEITNLYGSVLSEAATLLVNPAGVSLGLYPGLTITGAIGKTFGIQYTTNLALSNGWITLSSLTLTQPAQLWFDTNANVSSGAYPLRLYRVVAIP